MKKLFPQRVHFVGIGGIGMSALAQHLLKLGVEVSGSDRQEGEELQKLRNSGAKIFVPHRAENVGDAQLVVRTSAVCEDNCEICFAKRMGVKVILREQLLGEIFNSFPVRIAVCGTHGKTTVTAMLHHALKKCGIAHTAFIGGNFHGENYFFGEGVVVAEACEYNRSFLNLNPTICLCLNCKFDHPDCYKNSADVENAFRNLFAQSQKVVICKAQRQLWQNAIPFDETLCAKNISQTEGRPRFDLYIDGNFLRTVQLSLLGEHNIQNALAAICVCQQLNLPLLQVCNAMSTFDGVERRWSVASNCTLPVVCDYAHHPDEIVTTLKTAQSICKGKIFCVFQPHTYSRTKAFFEGFVTCFDGAHEIVYLPVFSARERAIKGATSRALFLCAKSLGKNAKYFNNFEDAARHLKHTVKEGDLVVLVGAGDIVKLANLL